MSRDRRDFTEAEYKRELELHHVKLEKGQSAALIYRKQPESVRDAPKSGVFRDFAEYGVHPARVVVQRFRLTIPFLLAALSAEQLAMEITNQKARTEARKKDVPWPEEEEVIGRELTMSGGRVRRTPSVDAAYELIVLIQKAKNHVGWTPAMQHYMSTLNLFLFRIGEPVKIRPQFLIPPRERAMADLTGLVSKKIAEKEIDQRRLKDPTHWAIADPQTITLVDVATLVGQLMKAAPYTQAMRDLVDWYKIAYRRSQYFTLIENILNQQERFLITIRVGR
jgi:hypothetical protein